MTRLFVLLGAASGLIGVAAGAFGAHALRDRLSAQMLAVYETGVRYQLIHALALLAAAWAAERWPGSAAPAAGWLFLTGTLLFSGSLYALSLSSLRWPGAITPLGGLGFLAGWACLFWAALRG
ncbi:MAG: DUF423 domain-containing protein [Gemmatimonadota bacterium]|nr:MAG: DUF423 domain-containing protein [Gemmatimonadota bacterium]